MIQPEILLLLSKSCREQSGYALAFVGYVLRTLITVLMIFLISVYIDQFLSLSLNGSLNHMYTSTLVRDGILQWLSSPSLEAGARRHMLYPGTPISRRPILCHCQHRRLLCQQGIVLAKSHRSLDLNI